ncbi:MAG: class I poly(R)-hydroxyalkanoic acid synthase [Gammaproteobacteria bacterium]|nr:class I poly(R)-hydroxyalkanoic acid synthase [Gammaproteobacteria bacterium]
MEQSSPANPLAGMAKLSQDMLSMFSQPERLIATQTKYATNMLSLWQRGFSAATTEESVEPVVSPSSSDKRWKDPQWQANLGFSLVQQAYLLTSDYMRELCQSMPIEDAHQADQLRFYTEQVIAAMAPTNFPQTNPAVLSKTVECNGENLMAGYQNFMRDLDPDQGQLKIAMTDKSAFTIGENIATTDGAVVFRNRMIELIQYAPSTGKVLKRPLMIVPPWINKFYILDLQPKNSMIKWLVEQGHTVFVLSWVNPDASYRDVGFNNYMEEGIYAATDFICQSLEVEQLNAIGYCIGGTLLSATLAHMKAIGDKRIVSATFFTSMIDFAEPGELGLFVDEPQLQRLEAEMAEHGILKGQAMASTFNMLRANDLIWSFYVNNYLMGNQPPIFDLLYWNSDSTQIPAATHSFYLRNMYQRNLLCQPGALQFNGVDIDISKVDIPVYFLSAQEDHIAPWKSTYAGAQLFAGDVTFVLGQSGHIAGVVNPPSADKYGYYTTDQLAPDADGWLESASEHKGSWWMHWHDWVQGHNKVKVNARTVVPVDDSQASHAPGSYVKVRYD